MAGKLTRHVYEGLIAGNLGWLEAQPRTLERDHIIAIVKASPDHEYGEAADLRQQLAERDAQVAVMRLVCNGCRVGAPLNGKQHRHKNDPQKFHSWCLFSFTDAGKDLLAKHEVARETRRLIVRDYLHGNHQTAWAVRRHLDSTITDEERAEVEASSLGGEKNDG